MFKISPLVMVSLCCATACGPSSSSAEPDSAPPNSPPVREAGLPDASRSHDATPSSNRDSASESDAGSAHARGALVWEALVTGEVYANPTVDSDGTTLYVGTHADGGILYKLDGRSGTVIAQAQANGQIEHSPALDEDGVLYIATLSGKIATGANGAGRSAAAYRASDLSKLWETQLGYGSDNSPVLGSNGRVYIGVVANPKQQISVDNCHNQNKCGRYFSLDRGDGAIKIDMWLEGWQATPAAIDGRNRLFFGVEDITGSEVSPALWPGVFWAVDGSDPAAGSKTAKSLWAGERLKTQGDFGSPNQIADDTVFATCRDGNLYGFAIDTGAIVLKRALRGPSWTGVAIQRNDQGKLVLYTGDQAGYVYAIEMDGTPSGKLLWEQRSAGGLGFGTPALDDQGNVYYTTTTPYLEVRTPSGELLLSEKLPGSSLGGVGGPTLLDNGLVVVGTNGGKVLAFQGFGAHLSDTAPWPKYKHDLRNTSNVTTKVRGR